MIWKALLRIARAQLRRWSPAEAALDLAEAVIGEASEEITESVYPSIRPPPLPDPLSSPLSHADVQRQQAQIRSAAHAFPELSPVTSSIPSAAPTLDTLPFTGLPSRPRSSAAPPPVMPPPVARIPNRPSRKH